MQVDFLNTLGDFLVGVADEPVETLDSEQGNKPGHRHDDHSQLPSFTEEFRVMK